MIKQKIYSPRSVCINMRNVPPKIKHCNHQYQINSNDAQHNSQQTCSDFIKQSCEAEECDRNCSGQMKNYTEFLTCPTQNCFQLEKDLIAYLKDYEQINNGTDLKTFQIQKHADLCLIGILEKIINQFFEGQDSQIFLHDEINGFDILYSLNKILLKLEEKKQKSFEKKDDDQYKISFINIISDNLEPTTEFQEEKFSKNFQSFTLIYPQQQLCQNEILNNQDIIDYLKFKHQYICPIIENEKVYDPLDFLYKYFIKSKLREFRPNFIVMAVEINDELKIENQLLEKLVWQLEQQCQQQLILIPYKVNNNQENSSVEKYIRTSLCLINSLLTQDKKQNRKKSKYFNNPSHHYYQNYHKYFTNTKKNERIYKLQSNILECLNAEGEDVQKLDQGKNQKTKVNEQLAASSIALLEESQIKFFDLYKGYSQEFFDSSEEKLFINTETKYYVSYKLYDEQLKQTQIILIIIQDSQLFYSIFITQPNVQNNRIYLKQLNTYEHLEGSSFLLRENILYQVQLKTKTNDGIVKGKLNKYQFNSNSQKIYSSSFFSSIRNADQTNIQEIDFDLIENFTLLYHNDENISAMGGIFKGSIYYHTGFLLRKNNQNNYQIAKFKKHDVNGKFMYKLRGYDNALILNTEINNQFLYFESINKFSVKSLEPSMFKLNFSLLAEIPSYTFDQSVQIINKEELLNKYLLFRADRFNVRISSEKNHLRYDIIIQEVVKDNFKLKQLSDIKYINQLGKLHVLQAFHFTIKFENLTKLKITQSSSLQPVTQIIDVQKSLVQKCLYQNWLEDEKNNKIFHFDNHRNMYLLYYKLYKKHEARKFIFISENQQVENDYQEVILNDLYNENIWIVRKIYQESGSIDLVLYICYWINLLDLKETASNQISQVKINEVYRIKNYDEDFNLIGMQLQENQNNLFLYSSKCILKFPVKLIKEKLWQNILSYLPNSWIKQKVTFEKPIHEQQNLNLKFSTQTPSTIVSDSDGKILIFYTYCNINYLNKNQNQLFFKYFELDQYGMNLQSKLLSKTINIAEQILLCKITSVYAENQQIVMGVIIQHDSQNFETRILTFNQIEEETQRNQIVEIQNNNYEHLNNISSLKREQKNCVETLLYSQNESKLLPF